MPATCSFEAGHYPYHGLYQESNLYDSQSLHVPEMVDSHKWSKHHAESFLYSQFTDGSSSFITPVIGYKIGQPCPCRYYDSILERLIQKGVNMDGRKETIHLDTWPFAMISLQQVILSRLKEPGEPKQHIGVS